MRIRIQSAALAYVLPHVSREASRPILGGVCLEPCGVIVATDGRTLCAHRNACAGVDSSVIVAFREPRKVAGKRVSYAELEIPDAGPRSGVVVTLFTAYGAQAGVALADVVEGPFPHWRGVCPTGPADTVKGLDGITLDPANVAKFSPVGRATLTFYGATRAVGVTFDTNADAYGLLMPCTSSGAPEAPGWLRNGPDSVHVLHPDAPAAAECAA